MNNLKLSELDNEKIIIQKMQETIKYISINGYDNDINKNNIIDFCRKIRDKGGRDLWTKDCAKKLGQIIKLITKFNNLNKLHKQNSEKIFIGKLKMIGKFYKIDFTKIKYKVKKIKCGASHIAFLTDKNKFYTLGKNGFGQIGNKSRKEVINEPFLHNDFNKIKDFCCGYSYTCVINDNDLYSWGAGDNGRLGLGNTNDYNFPQKVKIDFIPKVVEAGSTVTLILSEQGTLYSCGQRKYTGHKTVEDVLSPQLLDRFDDKKISKIRIGLGGYHSIVLTKSGELYTWGHNRVGQLGLGFLGNKIDNGAESEDEESDDNVIIKPTLVELSANIKIKDIKAGWGHSMILTFDNHVLVCGRNSESQLGIKKDQCEKNINDHKCISRFTYLDDINIEYILAGGTHSILVNHDNQLKIFGEELNDFNLPKYFNRIISSGSNSFFYV